MIEPLEQTSVFIDFMGNSPVVRVFDYLLTERELDFSITDIAENSHIGRATLYRIWNDLIKNEILTHTRIIGKAKLFKLNTDNPNIQKLVALHDSLTLEELKKRQMKESNKERKKKSLRNKTSPTEDLKTSPA